MARRQRQQTDNDAPASTEPSYDELKGLVAKGEPLPSGYAYNPRHKPPIYRKDGDSVPEPAQESPEATNEGQDVSTE